MSCKSAVEAAVCPEQCCDGLLNCARKQSECHIYSEVSNALFSLTASALIALTAVWWTATAITAARKRIAALSLVSFCYGPASSSLS